MVELKTVIEMIEKCDQRMEYLGLPRCYDSLHRFQLSIIGICIAHFILSIVYTLFFEMVDTLSILMKILCVMTWNVPWLLVEVTDITFYALLSLQLSFLFTLKLSSSRTLSSPYNPTKILHISSTPARHICLKFQQLNSFLQGMLKSRQSPQDEDHLTIFDYETKKYSQLKNEGLRGNRGNASLMKAAKQIHLELIRTTRLANDAYGLQILITISISFVLVISLLFTFYKTIWLDLTMSIFLKEVLSLLISLFYLMLKIGSLNFSCLKIISTATSTGDIICDLYKPWTTKEFRAEIRDFTLQLVQNPLVLTACGFWNIDHNFLQSVVGTMTTYLVILMQVGGESRAPDQRWNETATSATP
ncbi:uncharacterized protein LOC143181428 [Calliopsis andreniformis]|uniref:uncharacterized protein LOC143181428 n=1 Tax=Calliopsis andreniformis TaxID=337506 RepID=UPI003FCDF55B